MGIDREVWQFSYNLTNFQFCGVLRGNWLRVCNSSPVRILTHPQAMDDQTATESQGKEVIHELHG